MALAMHSTTTKRMHSVTVIRSVAHSVSVIRSEFELHSHSPMTKAQPMVDGPQFDLGRTSRGCRAWQVLNR